MTGATMVALALAAAAIVAIAGYVWLLGRRVAAHDLLVLAVIALIASCSAAPK